ncbi:MAG: hypothetical protein QOC62_4920 [Mycobacterium sp.]|jgi:predicted SnoaL-like aldol condensation-catalyzing enzyme|nr:hypothetical protein [Mycobacterium sp.]
MTEAEQANKALVIEAFDTLFNRRDYATAQRFWSQHYIQHSAHIKPGRDGLFDLVKTLPAELRYEHQLVLADGDYVSCMAASPRSASPPTGSSLTSSASPTGRWPNTGTSSRTKSPAPSHKGAPVKLFGVA